VIVHFEHEEARVYALMQENAAKYGGERDVAEAFVHLATAANAEDMRAILNALFTAGVSAGIAHARKLVEARA
jgi:hypothetical protein